VRADQARAVRTLLFAHLNVRFALLLFHALPVEVLVLVVGGAY